MRYRYRLDHPRGDTPTLRSGRTAHTAVFEPDRFALEYAVFKGPRRAGKAWEAFEAAHAGDTILKVDEYERCIAIRDAVRNHPIAGPYLAKGRSEFSIRWKDPDTQLACKARLDFVSDSKPALVDLKTTRSIVYPHFAATAYKLGYHCQLGYYQWGLKLALGLELPVKVIAVESEPPHDVAVFEYGEPELGMGLLEAQSLLIKLGFHREKQTWPGMYDEEQVLEFPAWATEREDENLEELGLED
jgi:hypothetical protein